jgi:hypothetical protein
MNPPHNDDYLHTQLPGYQVEEPAPAHHLPLDRVSPAEPALGAAGEFGEYMPQADLAGTPADSGGETPASDPAADGDDEDVHVAHAADVEVHRAVADETLAYEDVREEQATGAEEHGEGEPVERHAHEGQAADVEVPRAVVNEMHAHSVDRYEEPAGDAHVHDAAAREWQVDEASVPETDVSEAAADDMAAHGTQLSDEAAGDADVQDAAASELPADVEVQLMVADERAVYGADTYQEPAGDAEVHEAVASQGHAYGEEPAGQEEHLTVAGEAHAHSEPVADGDAADAHDAHTAEEQHDTGDEHRGEALHEEHMHAEHTAGHTADHTHEGDTHDEPALLDHQDAAGVDAEQPVESEDEEQAAVLMQAGPPSATMEESDVMVATHTAPEAARDDATGASEALGANGAATEEQAMSMASAHTAVHPSVTERVSSAGDARGMLEGVAESLRTLAGRDAHGEGIAIFPRGVDVLEVRMHISRDRDIDLNFRVAGPAVSSTSI